MRFNHNCSKILKSHGLATALISALTGQWGSYWTDTMRDSLRAF